MSNERPRSTEGGVEGEEDKIAEIRSYKEKLSNNFDLLDELLEEWALYSKDTLEPMYGRALLQRSTLWHLLSGSSPKGPSPGAGEEDDDKKKLEDLEEKVWKWFIDFQNKHPL